MNGREVERKEKLTKEEKMVNKFNGRKGSGRMETCGRMKKKKKG